MEGSDIKLKEKFDKLNKMSNDCLEKFVLKGYLEILARAIIYVEYSDRNKAEEILLKMDEVTRLKVRAIVEKIREGHFLWESEIDETIEQAFLLMDFNPFLELSEIVDEYDNFDTMYDTAWPVEVYTDSLRFSKENPVLEKKLKDMYLGFYDLPNRVIPENLHKNILIFDMKMIASALCPKQKELKDEGSDKGRYQNVVKLFMDAYNDKKALELESMIKEFSNKLDESEIVFARKELISAFSYEQYKELITEIE